MLLRVFFCCLCLNAGLRAQEGGGQAEIGFQQYYLAIGSERVVNISGLTLKSAQFIPNVGLLSASLTPAVSSNRFQTGDNYLQLKGLPWKGQHWTFTAGDFRLPGQLLAAPFPNIYFPEIAGRGAAVEVTHGNRVFGFIAGEGTITNTPRVVVRLQVPQTILGLYFRQKLGNRLLVGARFIHVNNDLVALRKQPNLLTQTNLKSATALSLNALYTLAGPLKIYGEAAASPSEQEGANMATRTVPVSILAGPILETNVFTFRSNYIRQSASYFPLLGYYLGDREGPFGELKFRPLQGIEVYGSASAYQNNLAKDVALPTFRNTSESAGISALLPGKISVNAQFNQLDLSTKQNASSSLVKSKSQQETLTVSRRVGRHNFRVSGRDFHDISSLNTQRQRSAEIEDTFPIRRLTVSGAVRAQRLSGVEGRFTLFYRGSAQFQKGRFAAYGNFETGSDLQNKTLFATNTISTTVFGASLTVGKNWEFQGEAYRNNLITELNPQSIFTLQGQGVFIPGTLAALNQWSIYFRMSRRFSWGKAGSGGDLSQYSIAQAPLRGSVEGFVVERSPNGNVPAEGVSVSIDGRIEVTDSEGRFRFMDVAEGTRKVALSLHELPADFEPGSNTEATVLIRPGKPSRADFEVVRLTAIHGTLNGPKDKPLDTIAIRLLPGERYTTPDPDGNFSFYNLRLGEYEVVIDEKTLPEYAVLKKPARTTVSIEAGKSPAPVHFEFEIHTPVKPVRTVLERK
jgi:hypothetical protein